MRTRFAHYLLLLATALLPQAAIGACLLSDYSVNSSGRFPMQPGGRYVLFVYRDAGRLVVDNCGNSGPVSEKAAVLRAVEAIAGRERSGQNPNFALHSDAAYGHAGERGVSPMGQISSP